jgi:hypothetical protein
MVLPADGAAPESVFYAPNSPIENLYAWSFDGR